MKLFFSAAFQIACFCLAFCFGGWFVAWVTGQPDAVQSSFSGWGLLVGFVAGLIWFFVIKAKDKATEPGPGPRSMNSLLPVILLTQVDPRPLAVLFALFFALFLFARFCKPVRKW